MAGFTGNGNKGQGAGVTSLAIAFPSAVATGNLLVAGLAVANTTGATASDNVNAGNYSVALNHPTGNTSDDNALYYKENTAAGTPTVTFGSIPAGNAAGVIGEYSGVLTSASIDKSGATDANGTTITSASLTNTGANGDLCIAILSLSTQNVTITNTTTGWSVDETNSPNATESTALASRVQIPAAAFTTTFTESGVAEDMSVNVASFKLAGAAGGMPSMQPGHIWRRHFQHRIEYLPDVLSVTPPAKQPAESWVLTGQGGRPARRRVGTWHTIADSGNTLLQSEIPQLGNYSVWVQSGKIRSRTRAGLQHHPAESSNTVYQDVAISQAEDRSWRARVPAFRNNDQDAGNFLANILQPFRKLAEWMVQAGRAGRAARRRVGAWHQVADQANTLLQSEIPQLGSYSVSIQTGKVRARRRGGVQHHPAESSNTVYQDVAISQAEDRSWRAGVPRFRNWDLPAGPFIAVFNTLFPLAKKLAEWWVQSGRAGRAARRRIGSWYYVADQSNTSLLASSETQQVSNADSFISTGKVRARRRAGQAHRASTETNTAYADNAISITSPSAGSGWRARVPRFKVFETSATFLANLSVLAQPLRQLASWMVQTGRGGRPARRRVGTWHQVSDQANTSLQSAAEQGQTGLADVFTQTGKVRSRRRAGQQHRASTETNTVYQDSVIGEARDRGWRARVPRFLNFDQSGARLGGWLNQPFRKLAEWWVQAGRGGRAARRRVGTWHQVSDQANTSLQSAAELPPRMVADIWAMTGKSRGRRRAGLAHQTASETHTVFADQVISRAMGDDVKPIRKLSKLASWWQTASNWLLNLFTAPVPGSVQIFISDAYRAQVAASEAFSSQAVFGRAFETQTSSAEAFAALAGVADAFAVRVVATDIYGSAVAFYVGKAIRLANWAGTTSSPTGGYRNVSGTLYDPTTPSLKYRLPGASEVTVSGGSLTHDGVGLYSFIVTPTQDGDAMATFVSSDGAYADPITFKIEPAPL